jgi:hypothetical protein
LRFHVVLRGRMLPGSVAIGDLSSLGQHPPRINNRVRTSKGWRRYRPKMMLRNRRTLSCRGFAEAAWCRERSGI